MDTKTFFSYGYVRALVTIILIGIVAALAAYTHWTLTQTKYMFTGPTTINVRGEGEILARPDIGQFSFSVRAEGADAATAQENSAEAINDIIGHLKEGGVAEKDIKTLHYNLNPKYRYEERVCEVGVGYCPPGERVVDGYEVNQAVLVKVRDLDSSGALITEVGEHGATNISSLQFTIDDESVLKAEAREEAIADAKEKARELANDLGVRIVRISGYWEDEGGGYPEPYYAMDASMESGGVVRKTVPDLPTGENTILSRVTITFEVR